MLYLKLQDNGLLRAVALAAALLVFSCIWTLVSLRGLMVDRAIRMNRFQAGSVFEERFEVINHLPLVRIWLEIQDEGSLNYHAGSRVLSWIGPKQRRSFIARTRLFNRGSYILGPTRVISGDPFGLFETSRVLPGQKTILVLPYFKKLNSFAEPAGLLSGGRAQRRKTLEVTPYAAGVREYAPGDPLSRIHWRSTARKGRLMVKEFEQDQFSNVWIFLDGEKNIHFRDRLEQKPSQEDYFWLGRSSRRLELPKDTFEYAVSAAASVAEYYLRAGKSVGLASAGRSNLVINPDRGERHLAKILSDLAFVEAMGDLPLAGLLKGQLPNVPKGSIVIVISPAQRQQLFLALAEIYKRNLTPVMISINAASFGAPGRSAPDMNGFYADMNLYQINYGDDIQSILEGRQ